MQKSLLLDKDVPNDITVGTRYYLRNSWVRYLPQKCLPWPIGWFRFRKLNLNWAFREVDSLLLTHFSLQFLYTSCLFLHHLSWVVKRINQCWRGFLRNNQASSKGISSKITWRTFCFNKTKMTLMSKISNLWANLFLPNGVGSRYLKNDPSLWRKEVRWAYYKKIKLSPCWKAKRGRSMFFNGMWSILSNPSGTRFTMKLETYWKLCFGRTPGFVKHLWNHYTVSHSI